MQIKYSKIVTSAVILLIASLAYTPVTEAIHRDRGVNQPGAVGNRGVGVGGVVVAANVSSGYGGSANQVRVANDPGVNQPGAAGNVGVDPGLNQPGAAGNVGTDPGVNQPGAAGNRK